MPDRVLLVMAEDDTGKPVAGALNLIGSDCLFGRNWGCQWGLNVKFLHFELCYYQVQLPRCADFAGVMPHALLTRVIIIAPDTR